MLWASALTIFFLYLIIFGKEAWPFTRYPMFSRLHSLEHVCVTRLALESHQGKVDWWRPHFYRDHEQITAQIVRSPAELLHWLSEALRLIEKEEGTTSRYRAVHIVERTWDGNSARDRTVKIIPVAGIHGDR